MPTRPPRHRPSHVKLTTSGRAADPRRSAASRGYGHHWRKYRKIFLSLNPVCAEPGCACPATQIDHIKAVSGPDDPLFWDEDNHRGYCNTHHSQKTAREDGSFGRGAVKFSQTSPG